MKNTYKILVILVLAFVATPFYAQQGFGTSNPDKDAVIDLTATNKGLLLPRLALTSTTAFAPLTAHVAGMQVYNTATAGDVTPGYYNNDGTKWFRMGYADNAWNTVGNAGTVSGTNFMGTTDAQDLVFKTNNESRAYLGKNGNLFVGIESDINNLRINPVFDFGGLNTINKTHNIFNIRTDGAAFGWAGIAAGGTSAAPTLPIANSLMGATNGINYDGAGNFRTVIRMRYHNVGAPTATSMPTKITFWTTPPSSIITVERLVINENGNIGIGTSTPTDKLDVNGTTRIQNLPASAATDQIVVADAATGQLHKSTVTATQLTAADLTNDAWINNTVGARVELGTTSAGAARAANDQIHANDDGRFSIGTNAFPDTKLSVLETGLVETLSRSGYFLNNSTGTTGNNFKYGLISIANGSNTGVGARNYAIRAEVSGAAGFNYSGSFIGGNFQIVNNLNSVTTTSILNSNVSDPLAKSMLILGKKEIASGDGFGYLLYNNDASTTLPTGLQAPNSLSLISSGDGGLDIGTNNSGDVKFYAAPGLSANPAQRMIIKSDTGNVGIGTTTPSVKAILDLTATDKGLLLPRMTTAQRNAIAPALTDKGLHVFDTIENATFYWNGTVWVEVGNKNIYTSDGTLTANRTVTMGSNNLAFTGTGNVGIGTSAPTAKVSVVETNTTALQSTLILSSNPQGGGAMSFNVLNPDTAKHSSGIQFRGWGGLNEGGIFRQTATANKSHLWFTVNNTNDAVMTLTENLNVGIGTTTPTERLSVAGNITLTGQIIPPALVGANITMPSNRRLTIGGTANAPNETGEVVTLSSANNTRNVILSLYKIGANTSFIGNPGNGLVLGADGLSSSIVFKTGLITSATDILASGLEVMRITVGNVGIGTSGPTEKLDVVGNVKFSGALMPNGLSGAVGQILTSAGSALAPTWVTPSAANTPNIYTADGTLTANRTVTMGSNNLAFTGTGNVGIGTTSPNAKLDIRVTPTSTSDPGEGMFGLGTTAALAPAAGAGAVRYNTASGGILQYSNGTAWNTLASSVAKATVIAKNSTALTVANATEVNVTDWSEITDLGSDFAPTTGIFTAPRTGSYSVSFSYNFTVGTIAANSQVECLLVTSSGATNTKKSVTAFPAGGSSQAGSSISFVIRLTAGETVRPVIYHTLGVTRTLRVGTGTEDGFVNFSVAEL